MQKNVHKKFKKKKIAQILEQRKPPLFIKTMWVFLQTV